jgi:hypothetical protein
MIVPTSCRIGIAWLCGCQFEVEVIARRPF